MKKFRKSRNPKFCVIPVSWKSGFFLKIPEMRGFFLKSRDSEFFLKILGIGIFYENPRDSEFFLKIPGILSFFWKSPDFGIFQDSGFFALEILIPGIRDFSKFRDFYLRNLSKIPGFRDFLPSRYPGVFSSRIGIFFVGWDIPKKS